MTMRMNAVIDIGNSNSRMHNDYGDNNVMKTKMMLIKTTKMIRLLSTHDDKNNIGNNTTTNNKNNK